MNREQQNNKNLASEIYPNPDSQNLNTQQKEVTESQNQSNDIKQTGSNSKPFHRLIIFSAVVTILPWIILLLSGLGSSSGMEIVGIFLAMPMAILVLAAPIINIVGIVKTIKAKKQDPKVSSALWKFIILLLISLTFCAWPQLVFMIMINFM